MKLTTNNPAATSFNLIDVFAGVGGFTLGFLGKLPGVKCEFRPRLLVDVDQQACQVAKRNIAGARTRRADVHELSGADLRRFGGLADSEPVHLLLGGPPCQGFSFLGRRALDDPRNVHIVDFLRLVKELRPWAAVMENVPLLITNHDGTVIKEICASLSDIGYASCHNVLSANEFGVPQIRKRAFVVAYRADLELAPDPPTRTHERVPANSELLAAAARERYEPGKLPYVSVEEAIGDLPPLRAGEGEEVMCYQHSPESDYQASLRAGSIAVFNHRSRAHSEKFLAKIAVIEEGGRNQDLPDELRFSDKYFSQAYARLHRHSLANTITTYFGNPGSGRFMHYRDLRSITVREAARLQSFPDSFVFDGDLATQMRHVGNAVPPLLAKSIALSLSRDLLAFEAKERRQGTSKAVTGVSKPKRAESPAERSRVMRSVPSKHTSVEIMLRKALAAAGIRGYRTHKADVPGSPDLVFSRNRLAVFVDGCFWHGCPKCYREPNANRTYWQMKVKRNRDRDTRVVAECRKAGWHVVRVWEHDVLRAPDRAANKVIRALIQSKSKPKKR